MNDDIMLKMPLSYNSLGIDTANDLRDALATSIYMHNDDCLCENPWTVKGIEAEQETKIGIDWGALSEIINRAVREAIQEENALVTPEIEKYHIKHR